MIFIIITTACVVQKTSSGQSGSIIGKVCGSCGIEPDISALAPQFVGSRSDDGAVPFVSGRFRTAGRTTVWNFGQGGNLIRAL